MATFSVMPDNSIQMELHPLSDFAADSSSVNYSDSTAYEIISNVTSFFVDLGGSFTYPDDNPDNIDTATGGTIDNIDETDDASFEIWTYTGGNIDVVQFLSHLGADDGLGLFSLLLNGNDLIIGANLADHLYGFGGNDNIFGADGNDRLFGMSGNDRLHGGTGNDVLAGGVGADKFFFDTRPNAVTNVDTITDFTPAQGDKIMLSETDFPKLGPHGMLTATHFQLNHAANSSPAVIYTAANGYLYYDANGNLHGGMTHFATLSTHPVIHNTDFIVMA